MKNCISKVKPARSKQPHCNDITTNIYGSRNGPSKSKCKWLIGEGTHRADARRLLVFTDSTGDSIFQYKRDNFIADLRDRKLIRLLSCSLLFDDSTCLFFFADVIGPRIGKLRR